MKPETVKRIQEDFRSKRITSATQLAKEHGVSRSAVYRVIQKVPERRTNDTKTGTTDTKDKDDTSVSRRSSVSSDGSGLTFDGKVGRFADDLGLPEDAGKLDMMEEDDHEKAMKEAALENLMGNITGEEIGLKLSPGLERAIGTLGPDVPVNQVIPQHLPVYKEVKQVQVVRVDRAEMVQKIIFNVQHFHALLEPIIGPSQQQFISSLSDLSDTQLKETLTTLERTRSVGNMASGFKQVFYVAAQATEATSRLIGMKARGFTEHLRQQDDEITMIMKEMAIDQWEKVKALDSPQARLGIIFCMTLVQVDAKNRMSDQIYAASQGRVNPKVAEQTKDL